MAVNVVDGPGRDVEEPNWKSLIPSTPGRAAIVKRHREQARREWARVTAAMRGVGTLAPENAPQIKRLVFAYIRFEEAAAALMREGAVVKSPRTKVPQHSLWQQEARAASADATELEAELGLSPRRRSGAAKAPQRRTAAKASDAYLRPANKA